MYFPQSNKLTSAYGIRFLRSDWEHFIPSSRSRFGPEEAIESGGSSYALTIAIDPLGNLLIQAPENITFNAVGKGNEASNQLQVQHCESPWALEPGRGLHPLFELWHFCASGEASDKQGSMSVNSWHFDS
jgi:hypothetical protein